MLYRLLLFLHVTGVILWVGGGTMFQIRTERATKYEDVSAIRSIIDDGNFLGKLYFGPLTLLVLASGLGMVFESGWGFDEPFVIGGIIGLVASGMIGGMVIGKSVAHLATRLAENAAALDDNMRTHLMKLRNAGRIDALLMTAVVFLMTVKPGT